MNDETKDELMKRTREWLQSCVNAATRSGVPEEADLEAFILAHLDGEPARLASAREAAIMEWRAGAADRDELRADCERRIASAREEAREEVEVEMHNAGFSVDNGLAATIHNVADELRTLRARVAELEERMAVVLHAGPSTALAVSVFDRAKKSEAQVAAARAECARIHDVYPMEDAYAAATDVLRAMDEATKK